MMTCHSDLSQLTTEQLEELARLAKQSETPSVAPSVETEMTREEAVREIRRLALKHHLFVSITDNRPNMKYSYTDENGKIWGWSGHGAPTRWMREMLEKGHKKEEFLNNLWKKEL